jgi:hypothetical protein
LISGDAVGSVYISLNPVLEKTELYKCSGKTLVSVPCLSLYILREGVDEGSFKARGR